MKKSYLLFMLAWMSSLILLGVAQGATIHFNTIDPGTTQFVDTITTYDTHYVDMTGMAVTITFAGGATELVSWDSTGGAYGADWSLTSNLPATSTYSGGWWNFDTTNGAQVESIRLDGFDHNVLFDIYPYDNSLYSSTDQSTLGLPDPESTGTVGSEWGQALLTDIWLATSNYADQINITYIGEVALTGTTAVGDLFQSMQIDFVGDSFGANINDTFIFFQDTDNITPVPEPATALLFGSGLAGLIYFGRGRKKS